MPGKDESRTVDSICVTGEDKEIVKSQISSSAEIASLREQEMTG
jgi:hypothetical protein